MNPDEQARLSARPGDNLARLGDRVDRYVSDWRDARRRKDHPHVVADVLERANRALEAYSDALVLGMTVPKPKRGAAKPAEGEQ